MAHLTIVPHGDSAAVILPKNMLETLGLSIGDSVNATLGDRQLILRALDDDELRKLMANLTKEVLDRRSDAYQRLA